MAFDGPKKGVVGIAEGDAINELRGSQIDVGLKECLEVVDMTCRRCAEEKVSFLTQMALNVKMDTC